MPGKSRRIRVVAAEAGLNFLELFAYLSEHIAYLLNPHQVCIPLTFRPAEIGSTTFP